MSMTPITDYEDRAESLIPEFLKRNAAGAQSNFAKEVRAFAAMVQELEDAINDVYLYRSIDQALIYGAANGFGDSATENPILRDIGSAVGQPRYGNPLWTNAQYAPMIKAKIAMNASQGEPERIIAALQTITTTPVNTPKRVEYVNSFPAGITLTVEDPDTVPANMQQIMESVVSGGVSVKIQQRTGRPFCFSLDGVNPYYSYGKGFGINSTDVNGGQLAFPL
jgi:hypothetical protein